MASEEFRFVVVGKTGAGKSSSINTIVGKHVCEATASSLSVTKQCQLVEEDVRGKHLLIVDTPGLYDTESTEAETRKEIAKMLGLTTPGFHAFIVVIQIGRFTKDDVQSIHILAEMFRPELFERTVLLFTGVDQLEADGVPLYQFLKDNTSKEQQDLIARCGGRVAGFNNCKRSDTRQVDELMTLLSTIIFAKQGSYYTNETYAKAKIIIEQEENRRMREDSTKCRSDIRQAIRSDIAEETSLGKRLLEILESVAIPVAEYLAEAGKSIAKVATSVLVEETTKVITEKASKTVRNKTEDKCVLS